MKWYYWVAPLTFVMMAHIGAKGLSQEVNDTQIVATSLVALWASTLFGILFAQEIIQGVMARIYQKQEVPVTPEFLEVVSKHAKRKLIPFLAIPLVIGCGLAWLFTNLFPAGYWKVGGLLLLGEVVFGVMGILITGWALMRVRPRRER